MADLASLPAGGTKSYDVIANGNSCEISDSAYERIRGLAGERLQSALSAGFGASAVDIISLKRYFLGHFLNREDICTAVTTQAVKRGENGNRLRNEYRDEGISTNAAARRGMLIGSVVPRVNCLRWRNTHDFIDVESCGEFVDLLKTYGVYLAMYAVASPEEKALRMFDVIPDAPLHSPYKKGFPVVCRDLIDPSGPRDVYHEIRRTPLPGTIDTITRGLKGEGFAAERLRRECKAGDKIYRPTDLQYNFVSRVAVPVKVLRDGRPVDLSIIMSANALAGNHFLVKHFAETIFLRIMGREFSRMLYIMGFNR